MSRLNGSKNLKPSERAGIVLAKNLSRKSSHKKSNKQIAEEFGVSINRVDKLNARVFTPSDQSEYDKQAARVKFKTMRIVDQGFDLIEKKMNNPDVALRDIVGATKTAFDIHQLQTSQPTQITHAALTDKELAIELFRRMIEKHNWTPDDALQGVRDTFPNVPAEEIKLLGGIDAS